MAYTWFAAAGTDVPDIVQLALDDFSCEIDSFCAPDTIAYGRNVSLAVVNQFFNPGTELIQVARDNDTNQLLGYVWVMRGQRSPWSDEEMATVRIVHVALQLPVRTRMKLVNDMLLLWEAWASQYSIPIVCSTTMRKDTQAFLRLHERHGYDVRGSFAYKRLIERK